MRSYTAKYYSFHKAPRTTSLSFRGSVEVNFGREKILAYIYALSSTDEYSFDPNSVGKIPCILANLAEKTAEN